MFYQKILGAQVLHGNMGEIKLTAKYLLTFTVKGWLLKVSTNVELNILVDEDMYDITGPCCIKWVCKCVWAIKK